MTNNTPKLGLDAAQSDLTPTHRPRGRPETRGRIGEPIDWEGEPDTSGSQYKVLAAQVAGAHGVSGNVRLRMIGANPSVSADALGRASTLLAERADDGYRRTLALTSLRKSAQPKGGWIARFKGITDRDGAEQLNGCGLLVSETSLPALPDGEYYVDDLIGIQVETNAGRKLGELVEVLNTPANDVYVTSAGAMIPAVAAFVLSIDVADRRMVVTDVPGLLETS